MLGGFLVFLWMGGRWYEAGQAASQGMNIQCLPTILPRPQIWKINYQFWNLSHSIQGPGETHHLYMYVYWVLRWILIQPVLQGRLLFTCCSFSTHVSHYHFSQYPTLDLTTRWKSPRWQWFCTLFVSVTSCRCWWKQGWVKICKN